MDLDSSGFIEKCSGCGGEIIEVKKTKPRYFLGQFNHATEKKCNRCGQPPGVKNIVLSSSNKVLSQV